MQTDWCLDLGPWTTLSADVANVRHETIDIADAAPRMALRALSSLIKI